MKYQSGEKLNFSKKQLAELSGLIEKAKHYDETIADLSHRAGELRKKMWFLIGEIHPDSKGYDMTASMFEGEFSITIIGENESKKTKLDAQ